MACRQALRTALSVKYAQVCKHGCMQVSVRMDEVSVVQGDLVVVEDVHMSTHKTQVRACFGASSHARV